MSKLLIIKMFFILNLDKNLLVTPPYLGRNLDNHLLEILQHSVEGAFNERYGYILKVINVTKIGEGKVQDGSGDVFFPIFYKALVFMPYKGEVLDAQVGEIMEYGFLASMGPMSLFVAKDNISEEYYFDLDARPHPRLVNNSDQSKVIQRGSDVRVKIRGIKVTGSEMYGVCEMSDTFLGPINMSYSIYA